jgi:hypothetical protein
MKKLSLVALLVVMAASLALAQGNGNNYQPSGDVLGAHQNQGRGCAGCHTPHSGARGSGQVTTDLNSGDVALWGQDVAVLYGKTFTFGDAPNAAAFQYGYPETLPGSMAGGIDDAETGGLLMCLSCHDGSLTQQNMMTNQSYEQKIGVLPAVYGTAYAIPTLLGSDGGTKGDYYNDHPVGREAQISNDTGSGCTGLPPTGNCTGLVFTLNAKGTGGTLSVTAGSPYATFVQNYGWPALAPGEWSNPYGVAANHKGVVGPFVVCTTCHNQHVMNVYTSTAGGTINPSNGNVYGSPIAGDGGGHHYRTFFFVNGPYNVTANTAYSGGGQAGSTTQFCRQCHFGESNEENNGSIPTLF